MEIRKEVRKEKRKEERKEGKMQPCTHHLISTQMEITPWVQGLERGREGRRKRREWREGGKKEKKRREEGREGGRKEERGHRGKEGSRIGGKRRKINVERNQERKVQQQEARDKGEAEGGKFSFYTNLLTFTTDKIYWLSKPVYLTKKMTSCEHKLHFISGLQDQKREHYIKKSNSILDCEKGKWLGTK